MEGLRNIAKMNPIIIHECILMKVGKAKRIYIIEIKLKVCCVAEDHKFNLLQSTLHCRYLSSNTQ